MTAAEKAEAAARDLKPDRPVVPQLSIPLGRTPESDKAKAPRAAARGSTGASAVLIGDAVARCEAERDAKVRAECRDRLAHEMPSKPHLPPSR
jgi:hypothetical protein